MLYSNNFDLFVVNKARKQNKKSKSNSPQSPNAKPYPSPTTKTTKAADSTRTPSPDTGSMN